MPSGSAGKPGAGGEADKPPTRFERDLVKLTRSVAWFTGLLFLANAGALFFIYQQWSVANKTQIDTREQLRAVLTVQGAIVIPATEANGKIDGYNFISTFNNFGATRTASFQAWNSIKYFEGGVPNNLDLGKPYKPIDLGNSIIGPNSSYQLPPVGVPIADVQSVIDKKGEILLWGHGEYADIFDQTKIIAIKFCILINASVGPDGKTLLQAVPYRTDCNTGQ